MRKHERGIVSEGGVILLHGLAPALLPFERCCPLANVGVASGRHHRAHASQAFRSFRAVRFVAARLLKGFVRFRQPSRSQRRESRAHRFCIVVVAKGGVRASQPFLGPHVCRIERQRLAVVLNRASEIPGALGVLGVRQQRQHAAQAAHAPLSVRYPRVARIDATRQIERLGGDLTLPRRQRLLARVQLCAERL